MFRPLLVALTLLVSAPPANADVRLVTRQLPNGLTVVLAPDVPADTVAIQVSFDAGSRHDPARRHGTAWLASRIVGARLPGFRADVNQERSLLAAEVPLASLPETMGRVAAALATQDVASEELGATLDALVREARERTGAAWGEAPMRLLRLVYGSHPHGHEAQASPANVREKDVEEFLDRHYGMASAVLVVAGTFDEHRVLATIDAALATVRSGRPRQPCRSYSISLAREKRQSLRDRNATGSEISLAYPTVPATHPDWPALNILADILGQGPNARLQAKLVGKGLATQFGEGMTESPCAPSLLRMRTRIAPDVAIAAVQRAIDEEMTRLAQELVSPDELATAHEQERQWSAEQVSSASGIANAAARTALFYGDPGRINTDIALMVAVSRADVQRVAQRYLHRGNRAVVVSVGEK